MTEKIISEVTSLYGFCSFGSVSDKLINCRALSRIPENAKSIIVMLFPYNLGDIAYDNCDISRYAVVKDYHLAINEVLSVAVDKLRKCFPNEKFEFFTDNSPIPEVLAAVNAGLGVRGKNGLLINKEYGSWVFIAEIVTTLELKYPETVERSCIGCDRCIKECPNGAITENGINISKCLSEISQKKGELNDLEKNLIKKNGLAWGCDRCQTVCPMNKHSKIDISEIFKSGIEFKAKTTNISDRAYSWRGYKVIKRNIDILYRKG